MPKHTDAIRKHLGGDPTDPIEVEIAKHLDAIDAERKEMVEALVAAEYAIANSARLPDCKHKPSRDFDYEDFCVWAEHWVAEARAIVAKAKE